MSAPGHTPGPWWIEKDAPVFEGYYNINTKGWTGLACVVRAIVGPNSLQEECAANAHLIAAAPDHALVAWAVCAGVARWDRGELVFDGFRWSTKLDEFGVPELNGDLRDKLAKARAAA